MSTVRPRALPATALEGPTQRLARPTCRSGPPEAALLRPTIRGLLRLGRVNQMSLAGTEMPWHQKRVDLAVMWDRQTLAVELKVDNWRRAVEQAYINRWYADESWVGLWHAYLTPAAVRAASDAGVGVLVVTRGTIYPLQSPSRPPRPNVGGDLSETLRARGVRVRDLLGEVRRRGLPALA